MSPPGRSQLITGSPGRFFLSLPLAGPAILSRDEATSSVTNPPTGAC